MSAPHLWILSACVLAACGSDGPGTGPISVDDAEPACRRVCEHAATCPDAEPVETCTTRCQQGVLGGWLRADAFEAISDCVAELACGADDDQCLTACQPTASHERFEAQCRTVFATCAEPAEITAFCETEPMPGVEADDIGYLCVVTPSVIDELLACIPDGSTCAAVDCIEAVLESRGIDS